MTVRELVYMVCKQEAEALTRDVRFIDKQTPEPTEEYVEMLFQSMMSKSMVDVSYEKVIIYRSEDQEERIMEDSLLDEEVRDGRWFCAVQAEGAESVTMIRWCPHRYLAELMVEEIERTRAFDRVFILEGGE